MGVITSSPPCRSELERAVTDDVVGGPFEEWVIYDLGEQRRHAHSFASKDLVPFSSKSRYFAAHGALFRF
ncbi:hypothetical protein CEXT_299511 [Caerostris extrusa]|uniref:Uncharacterized protein n=1 Tax=Caerostris extrusa TaxID=172846 RepID=A0AAV4SDM8_CAEEX|nr:hypothetical protein CEXT_299511 [Caerostris extrusa]